MDARAGPRARAPSEPLVEAPHRWGPLFLLPPPRRARRPDDGSRRSARARGAKHPGQRGPRVQGVQLGQEGDGAGGVAGVSRPPRPRRLRYAYLPGVSTTLDIDPPPRTSVEWARSTPSSALFTSHRGGGRHDDPSYAVRPRHPLDALLIRASAWAGRAPRRGAGSARGAGGQGRPTR